ncbi:Proline dehydrogenase 1, mitochondrial [Hypsizygus marmoreus]|uniref:Proline dehydrogenase n=1 Tax=Hypsizygus marmoreus TaxID=39966 RepID=A0A369JRY6_HYPMA|nr:Proline dehydrogenase 1, mitochondrial [Hypsizygus marmoreus]
MLRVYGLLTRRSLLQVSRRIGCPQITWRNTSTHSGRSDKHRRTIGIVSGGALLALGLSPFYVSNIHADAALPAQGSPPTVNDSDEASLGSLIRAYAVFTMCSIPVLVDNSPKLLELAMLPGIRWFAETLVRITFFEQFVGGSTAQMTLPLLYKLRAANKGALFAYSVEVDEAEAMAHSASKTKGQSPYKRIVDEMIHCIDIAADFEDGINGKGPSGRRTWVALKFSALSPDSQALVKLSSHLIATRLALSTPVLFPGAPHATDLDILYQQVPDALTPEEITSLRELHADLVRICTRAQQRGVKVIIDAEYSWYQPAIDALTLSLMRQFNKLPGPGEKTTNVQPLVYGTYQAYLKRTQLHLAHALADAKANNYSLGVKLVRGAYHSHELAAHAHKASDHAIPTSHSLSISPDAAPPVWTSKAETDKCYNECVRRLVDAVKADVSALSLTSSLPTPSSSSSPSSSGFFSYLFRLPSPQNAKVKTKWTSRVPTIGVLFGTHNWESSELILEELVRHGLAVKVSHEKEEGKSDSVLIGEDAAERVAVGQLYGMSDELTNHLVDKTASHTPFIIKYVPYGALSDVMPYLSRRAIENKSVLGDGVAAEERRRAGAEIRKRIRGMFGI